MEIDDELGDELAKVVMDRIAEGDLGLRYCRGKWFVWTGIHWKMDDTGAAFDLIRLFCRHLIDGRDPHEVAAFGP